MKVEEKFTPHNNKRGSKHKVLKYTTRKVL